MATASFSSVISADETTQLALHVANTSEHNIEKNVPNGIGIDSMLKEITNRPIQGSAMKHHGVNDDRAGVSFDEIQVSDVCNSNLPESPSSTSTWIGLSTHECNPASIDEHISSLSSLDGLMGRRSSNWIMNNLTSPATSSSEEAGTCSGVVWVESVEPHSVKTQLVNINTGHPTFRQCTSTGIKSVNKTHFCNALNFDNSSLDQLSMTTDARGNKSMDDSIISYLRCANNADQPNHAMSPSQELEEPIHMTLEEIRFSLSSLDQSHLNRPTVDDCGCNRILDVAKASTRRHRVTIKDRFSSCDSGSTFDQLVVANHHNHHENKKLSSEVRCLLPKSLKHTLCHWLGLGGKGAVSPTNAIVSDGHSRSNGSEGSTSGSSSSSAASSTENVCSRVASQSVDASLAEHGCAPGFVNRALPPLPLKCHSQHVRLQDDSSTDEDHDYLDAEDRADSALPWWNRISAKSTTDFASSIQKVKDYGWYWGPISGQAAEAILANEPDGSFIVRDSSDEHYIFSLTFKLDGLVRHVRIEHDHGNFSFGTFTKFKSNTIVEFVENAVQHSRSGRYLFFLHRRPVLGPMRVQLLHPVSRFKQVQSLQHICRFVILKVVRRDLIDCLPLPNRLKDYLNTLQYYSEREEDDRQSN